MGLEAHRANAATRIGFAVVTVSDTRDRASDRGGPVLIEELEGAGHKLESYEIIPDEPDAIRAAARALVEHPDVAVALFTGGTGLAPRDVTAPTLAALFDAHIPGFGELFRSLSYAQVGSAAILSRATAGVIGETVVFALPGSPKALTLAMREIILREAGHIVSQVRGD